MRILFVGDLRENTRSRQRYDTLRSMDTEVHGVSTHLPWGPPRTLADRALSRLGWPPDVADTNAKLLEQCAAREFDLLWVEKALVLRPATLTELARAQPDMRRAFFSEDDMTLASNRSRGSRRMLPLYDVVFTTKSHNTQPSELPSLGAQRVVFAQKTFDPRFHRPLSVDESTAARLGAPITFVGTWERERADLCVFLARSGLPVRVWGEGWDRCRESIPGLRIEGRGIYGADYVRTLCASDINLGFLRRASRDLHTDRSVEIPACGAFLLAERTSEHLQLFREGEEAAFFLGRDELLTKVRHYLLHRDERCRIAAAGRERCLASDYSHERAIEQMLATVMEDRGRRAA